MNKAKFDQIVDRLSEQHGLSPQLTAAWLRNEGYAVRAVTRVVLIPQMLERLIAFAKV